MNSNINKTKRLSRDTNYNKSNKSYQETLTSDEIKEYLKEYKLIENIDDVDLNKHIRYFDVDPKTKEKKFRLGGTYNKKDKENRYIILSNGNYSWSIQLDRVILFEKLNTKDIIDIYENKIKKLKNNNQILVEEKKYLENENLKLKNSINQIKHEIIKKK